MSYTFAVNLLTQDDVFRVTRALMDAGVSDSYALPNYYARRPRSPLSSDPLAASWLHISKPSIQELPGTTASDAFPSDNPSIHYSSGYRCIPTVYTTYLTVDQFIMLIDSVSIIQQYSHS